MEIAFVHRNPTANETEKFRLLLSTYQDGTGMLVDKKKRGFTLPGWRDFERSVALAFNGEAQESKAVFDVLLLDPDQPQARYGLSCKMGNQLARIDRTGRAFMELSNSSKKFWDHLIANDISRSIYKQSAAKVGTALLALVEQWHREISIEVGGSVDLSRSSYLVLSYNKSGWYQLHQFPLQFPASETISWSFPVRKRGDIEVTGNLRGDDDTGMIFEWYGDSGGQLKYYPPVESALWMSERFRLEPLNPGIEQGVLAKAKLYFPSKWAGITGHDKRCHPTGRSRGCSRGIDRGAHGYGLRRGLFAI
jgi:hypothetical protein